MEVWNNPIRQRQMIGRYFSIDSAIHVWENVSRIHCFMRMHAPGAQDTENTCCRNTVGFDVVTTAVNVIITLGIVAAVVERNGISLKKSPTHFQGVCYCNYGSFHVQVLVLGCPVLSVFFQWCSLSCKATAFASRDRSRLNNHIKGIYRSRCICSPLAWLIVISQIAVRLLTLWMTVFHHNMTVGVRLALKFCLSLNQMVELPTL